jgi:hypothetical protein
MRKRVSLILAIGLGSGACSGGPSSGDGLQSGIVASQLQAPPESLSTAGEQELRAIAAAGKLRDLQWSNFSDLPWS